MYKMTMVNVMRRIVEWRVLTMNHLRRQELFDDGFADCRKRDVGASETIVDARYHRDSTSDR